MIAPKLVRLIETHSDQLARSLIEKLEGNEKVSDLRKIPPDELRQRAYDVYDHLSEWLLTKTESDVEQTYKAIGARWAAQGVALSHLLYGILAIKEHLWRFLAGEVVVDRTVEVFQELELFHLVDQFFDQAVYYAACGHESSQGSHSD